MTFTKNVKVTRPLFLLSTSSRLAIRPGSGSLGANRRPLIRRLGMRLRVAGKVGRPAGWIPERLGQRCRRRWRNGRCLGLSRRRDRHSARCWFLVSELPGSRRVRPRLSRRDRFRRSVLGLFPVGWFRFLRRPSWCCYRALLCHRSLVHPAGGVSILSGLRQQLRRDLGLEVCQAAAPREFQ